MLTSGSDCSDSRSDEKTAQIVSYSDTSRLKTTVLHRQVNGRRHGFTFLGDPPEFAELLDSDDQVFYESVRLTFTVCDDMPCNGEVSCLPSHLPALDVY